MVLRLSFSLSSRFIASSPTRNPHGHPMIYLRSLYSRLRRNLGIVSSPLGLFEKPSLTRLLPFQPSPGTRKPLCLPFQWLKIDALVRSIDRKLFFSFSCSFHWLGSLCLICLFRACLSVPNSALRIECPWVIQKGQGISHPEWFVNIGMVI